MHIKVEDGSGDSGEEEDQEAHHPARQAAASHRPARQAAAAALRHQLPAAGGHGPGDWPGAGAGPAGGAADQVPAGEHEAGNDSSGKGRECC